MASDTLTGAMSRVLAASKPGGSLLELGTGTGLSAAWLLAGMDATATLLSIDSDATVSGIAREHLGGDSRLTLVVEDGSASLARLDRTGSRFDLIFADAWPGKYVDLDVALRLLKPGAFFVIDDMLPQPNWPDGHAPKAAALWKHIAEREELQTVALDWSTGLLIAVRK